MKFVLLACICCGVASQAVAKKFAETPEGLKAALIAADAKAANLDGLSRTEQTAILEILRGIFDQSITNIGTIAPSQSGAGIALVRLDDISTIKYLVSEYQKYNSRAAWDYIPKTFQRAANPNVINYLAPDFQLNEPNDAFYGQKGDDADFGISVPPRSIYSGTITLKIIAAAPEFRGELQAWAKQAQDFRFQHPEAFRHLMRKWWEQNREAFEKKRYDAVQPIALVVDEGSMIAKTEPAPETDRTPLAPTPSTSIAQSISTISPSAAAPASKSSPIDWALIGGTLVAVILTATGMWKFLR